MRFIDRKRELAALGKFWKAKKSQLIVLYGRRRIGKTELIKEFIKNRPHIYFLSRLINEHENLKLLGKSVGEYFGDGMLQRRGFEDWEEFFHYIRGHIHERTVIAIDEFPYLIEANKGVPSLFQAGWDEYLKDSNVFLILCGSSMAMMEETVLSYKSPLYGRRTGQILLRPFPFSEIKGFYPKLSFDRRLELYSIAGGNPGYLNKLDQDLSFADNIREHILQPEAYLYNEVEFILREELREPRNYMAILKAIAMGRNRISEICNETGMDKSSLHKYLYILEDLHLIEKEVPVTEKNPLKSRKGIYRLRDQFFQFWFKYILPNKGEIEIGETGSVLKKIRKNFIHLVSQNYEYVSRERLREFSRQVFIFDKIGRWWKKDEEIDIVALNEDDKKILFGEVKLNNKPVGTNIYDNLQRKSDQVEWQWGDRKEYYCLFSKSGFTDAMMRLAHQDNLFLFHKDVLIHPEKEKGVGPN